MMQFFILPIPLSEVVKKQVGFFKAAAMVQDGVFGDGSGGMLCVGGVWGSCVGMVCGTACLGMVYVDGVLGDGGGWCVL